MNTNLTCRSLEGVCQVCQSDLDLQLDSLCICIQLCGEVFWNNKNHILLWKAAQTLKKKKIKVLFTIGIIKQYM